MCPPAHEPPAADAGAVVLSRIEREIVEVREIKGVRKLVGHGAHHLPEGPFGDHRRRPALGADTDRCVVDTTIVCLERNGLAQTSDACRSATDETLRHRAYDDEQVIDPAVVVP